MDEFTADEAQDWYFTFGIGHPILSRHVVKINGTWEQARATMHEVFGRNWAFQYSSADAAGVDRWGYTVIG